MNMLNTFIIKELTINDEEEQGIQAVSLVDYPAIEQDFVYFNKDVKVDLQQVTEAGVPVREFFEYTAAPEPEVISGSRPFCIKHHGKVYHISEIRNWASMSDKKENGFIDESNFFRNFSGNVGNFNVNSQFYNCRHWLRRVNSVNEIPQTKRKIKFKSDKEKVNDFTVDFKISNKEKREVEGMALKSGQFIYRSDIQGLGEGYVFFSRDTIRKLKEKYGYNRTITIQHMEDITGTAILLDSWLVEKDDENITEWWLKYKIIDEGLWQVIKLGMVKGFSIEGIFDVK